MPEKWIKVNVRIMWRYHQVHGGNSHRTSISSLIAGVEADNN